MTLKFRRGASTDRTSITPANGEPIWVTDGQLLYVGDGSTPGGVPVGGSAGGVVISGGVNSRSTGTVNFSNSNGVTFGLSDNGVMTASHNGITAQSTQPVAVSGQNGSYAFSTLSFSNANGVSFGTSAGSAVTASHNGLTSQSNQAYSAGNGSATFQTLPFADSNGVSFSTGTQGVFATVRTDYAPSSHSHGNPTLNLTNLSGTTASNSAGLTLSLSAASQSVQPVAASAANGSYAFSTLSFSNANGISFGTSAGSAVTASHNGITSQSVQTQNMVSILGSTGNISFANGNGITFGGNASTLTASHNGITQQSTQPVAYSAANGSANFSTLSFANSNGVSFSTGTQGVFATVKTDYLTTARASNDGIGLATAQSNVTWTVNSAGLSLDARSYAGVGTSATNASITLNSNGLAISVAAPGGGGSVGVSAGTTSSNLATINFGDGGGVSFGLDAGTVTGSWNSTHSHGNPTLALTNLSGTTASASNGFTLSLAINNNATISQRLQWPPGNLTAVAAMGNGSFSINRVQMDDDLIATRVDVPFLVSIASSATANTWGLAVTAFACIYTKNGNTLSSLTSAQNQWNTTLASNTAGATQVIAHAIRPMSVGMNMTFAPGEYYVGFGISTNTSSVGTATTALGNTWSVMGGPIYSSAVPQVGNFTDATNTSTGLFGGQGIYSAAISTVPPTVSLSAINQTGSYYARANVGLIFRNI